MLEKVASRRLITMITEMTTALFRRKRAVIKIFEGINYQYIYIFTTRKITEITLRSCSILALKSLFKFISQCVLVPYLESGLCKDGNELDNCDFTDA